MGVSVNLDARDVDGRGLGDVVVPALALLLLELERDAADGALLDAAHQVGGEASDLVAQTLGRDGGDLAAHALVGLEVGGEARVVLLDDEARSLLDGLCADATLLELTHIHKSEREQQGQRGPPHQISSYTCACVRAR